MAFRGLKPFRILKDTYRYIFLLGFTQYLLILLEDGKGEEGDQSSPSRPPELPLQYLKISKAAFNIPHKLAIAFLYCDDDREEKEKKTNKSKKSTWGFDVLPLNAESQLSEILVIFMCCAFIVEM